MELCALSELWEKKAHDDAFIYSVVHMRSILLELLFLLLKTEFNLYENVINILRFKQENTVNFCDKS